MKGVLLSITVSPVLQAILQIAGIFWLTPLRHWGWDHTIVTVVTYLVTISGAAVACLLPARRNNDKIVLIIGGIVSLTVFYALYGHLSNTPPRVSLLTLYELSAYVCFFGTYAAYGFSVGRIVTFYAGKAVRKRANTGTP